MSIRWRSSGELLCGAMFPEEPGDTYIDDRLHYQLAVITGELRADDDHENSGLWHWVRGTGEAIQGGDYNFHLKTEVCGPALRRLTAGDDLTARRGDWEIEQTGMLWGAGVSLWRIRLRGRVVLEEVTDKQLRELRDLLVEDG